MGDRSAQINLSAKGTGSVVVDGDDLSGVVRRLLMTAEVGEPPRLVLELAPRAFEVDADGTFVAVSPVGYAVLIELGWQPPPAPGSPAPDMAKVRRLAEALYRIDQTHLRHDNPHGQYHGYGQALLAALDGRQAQHDDQFTVPDLADDPDVRALLRQYEMKVSQLAELAGEMLREFTVRGNPGREAVRTPWLLPRTVDRWRARLHRLTNPPDSQPG